MGTLMLEGHPRGIDEGTVQGPKLVASDKAHPQTTALAVKPED